MPYKMAKEANGGTFRIKRVPIFAQKNAKGEEALSPKKIMRAVEYGRKMQAKGYFPPVHVGHHQEYSETESAYIGYLLNLTVEKSEDFGLVVYADIAGIPDHYAAEFKSGRFPHRSIELEAKEGEEEIMSLALLSHVVPHFQFPNLIIEESNEVVNDREPALMAYARNLAKLTKQGVNVMPCPEDKKEEKYQEEKKEDKGEKKQAEGEKDIKEEYAKLKAENANLLKELAGYKKKYQEEEDGKEKMQEEDKKEDKKESMKKHSKVLDTALEFRVLGLSNDKALFYAEMGADPKDFALIKSEPKTEEPVKDTPEDTKTEEVKHPASPPSEKAQESDEQFKTFQRELARQGIEISVEQYEAGLKFAKGEK